jgi:signal peptidase I
LVAVVAVAVVLVLVRTFVVETYAIPSDSMEPTLKTSDRIIVDKVAPSHVERGDVVVFDGQAFGGATAYVKRVIGIGGDEVSCCTDQGRLRLNGRPLDEPYVEPGDAPSDLRFDVRVPPGRLWVMGDHRSDSGDSRAHLGDPGGGMVPVGDVIGRAIWRYWPPSEFGAVPSTTATAAAPTPASVDRAPGSRERRR